MTTARRRVASAAAWLGILLLCAPGPVSAEDAIEISLGVGDQEVITAHDVQSYSEGVAGIADVRLTKDGTEFIVVGLRPGTTSLLVLTRGGGRRNYRILVRQAGLTERQPGRDYGPGTVDLRANIRLDVYFVRIGRSYRHQLGVAWPASVGGGQLRASANLLDGAVTDATVVAEQALPRLDMAEGAGWAKLLNHTALITTNGSEAAFGGGGEINVPIAGSLGGELRQIRYGSVVKVRPRYDSDSGRIELRVDADVSDLTSGTGTGVPGRATSTLQSMVNLELGQALVLAGLKTHGDRRASEGLPWLSRIPIVGALFGSQGRHSEETEAIVLVVPTVIDATSRESRRIVDDALRAYSAFEGDAAGGLMSTLPSAETGALRSTR